MQHVGEHRSERIRVRVDARAVNQTAAATGGSHVVVLGYDVEIPTSEIVGNEGPLEWMGQGTGMGLPCYSGEHRSSGSTDIARCIPATEAPAVVLRLEWQYLSFARQDHTRVSPEGYQTAASCAEIKQNPGLNSRAGLPHSEKPCGNKD